MRLNQFGDTGNIHVCNDDGKHVATWVKFGNAYVCVSVEGEVLWQNRRGLEWHSREFVENWVSESDDNNAEFDAEWSEFEVSAFHACTMSSWMMDIPRSEGGLA